MARSCWVSPFEEKLNHSVVTEPRPYGESLERFEKALGTLKKVRSKTEGEVSILKGVGNALK